MNYVMQDYVNGFAPIAHRVTGEVPYDHHDAALVKQLSQTLILASLESRIEGILRDIEGHLLSDLEDRELEAARKLSTVNLRAAGALVGVVLERHLSQVVLTRGLKLRKKNPTVSDFNELLKKEKVYDLPKYRKIQHMADIRNICCHAKGREPTEDELTELLSGIGSIIKTVF